MNMSETVYICGPMSGYPDGNYPAFDDARNRAILRGFIPISPADLNRRNSMPVPDENAEPLPDYKFYFIVRRDLDAVMLCDSIALLPGWMGSKGASTEYYLAKWLGKKFYDATGFSVLW
jgi:hypothetical protein